MRKIKPIFLGTILSLHLGCSKDSASKAEKKPKPASNDIEEQSDRKSCVSGIVEQVLDDARTVLFRPNKNRNKAILWDLYTEKMRKSMDDIYQIFKLNNNGNYFLKAFGGRRFQILSVSGASILYRESLLFTSGSDPKIKFSRDGNAVAVRFKKRANRHNKVIIYDIQRRDIVWNGVFIDTEKVLLNSLTSAVVISKENNKRFLNTIDPSRDQIVYQSPLPAGRLGAVHLSDRVITLEINGVFYGYEVNRGRLIFSKSFRRILSVDGDHALAELGDRSLTLFDLYTGSSIQQVSLPDAVERSRCKLNRELESIFCVDPNSSQQILKIDLGLGQSTVLCYQ